MSELNNLNSTRRMLRHVMHVAEQTRNSMGQAAQPHTRPSSEPSMEIITDALVYLAQAREGFIITLRTPTSLSTRELRALIERVMVDWDWLASMGLERQAEPEILPVEEPLIAYHHSLLALGVLPRLPPEAVTYPGIRRTYSDIPVPSTPHETLDRLEEMERALAEVEAAGGDMDVWLKEAVRHTYGFFEATHWLMVNSLRHLL
jgi:hypothetical protein